MAKRSGGPATKRPPPENGAGLHDEVKAFASSLGLAAGGGDGFNDSDFRPEVAKQRFGAKGGGQHKRAREHGVGNGSLDAAADGKKRARTDSKDGQRGNGTPRGAQHVPQQHRQPVDAKAAAALKSREWKEAVGPRPGERGRDFCTFADKGELPA